MQKVKAYNSLAGYFKVCQDRGIKTIYSLTYDIHCKITKQVFYSHKKSDINSRIKELDLTKYTIEHIKLG